MKDFHQLESTHNIIETGLYAVGNKNLVRVTNKLHRIIHVPYLLHFVLCQFKHTFCRYLYIQFIAHFLTSCYKLFYLVRDRFILDHASVKEREYFHLTFNGTNNNFTLSMCNVQLCMLVEINSKNTICAESYLMCKVTSRSIITFFFNFPTIFTIYLTKQC